MSTVTLDNKTILVTGAAGFIGSNLVKRIYQEAPSATVIGIDNMNAYYDVALKEFRLNELAKYPTFTFVKGNIADKELITELFEKYKPSVVVNLAAQAGVRYSITNPDAYVESNLVGFFNILEACRHCESLEHLVYASSSSVYGSNKKVGFIRTDADVGYYNAAVKIKTILVSIVTSLGVVLLPRASYYVEHSMMDEFYRITKKAINFVFLIATPMMIYFMLFAKEGVFFLSGDAYAGAIIPMQVIMPTLLFIGLTNIMGIQMLVPLGKEKVVLYSEIAGMIVDIILNALLIPKMASTGAAIGTLAAEIAVFIVQYVALRGIIKEAYRQVHYVAIGSSVLAGGVLAVLIKRMQWGSFMTLCASAIVFFGVYFLILTIAKESLVIEIENQLLGRIIKKK